MTNRLHYRDNMTPEESAKFSDQLRSEEEVWDRIAEGSSNPPELAPQDCDPSCEECHGTAKMWRDENGGAFISCPTCLDALADATEGSDPVRMGWVGKGGRL